MPDPRHPHDPPETEGLARSGAVAGLCPITEANLGGGIDARDPDLAGAAGDTLFDGFFVGGDRMVTDVWSAGRHVVREGRHVRRDEIVRRYAAAVSGLKRTL